MKHTKLPSAYIKKKYLLGMLLNIDFDHSYKSYNTYYILND